MAIFSLTSVDRHIFDLQNVMQINYSFYKMYLFYSESSIEFRHFSAEGIPDTAFIAPRVRYRNPEGRKLSSGGGNYTFKP